MPIYPSQLLPGTQGDSADVGQPVNIHGIDNDTWNGAFQDENGDTAFGTTGAVAALSALSVTEIQSIDTSVSPAYAEGAGFNLRVAQASYDITGGDDGAVGAHALGVSVPADCLAVGGVVDVSETFTDSDDDSATMAIHLVGANDIVTATAISGGGAIWDQGRHDVIPDGTGSTAVKTTAASEITVTVADDEIDSGAMTISLFYIPTEADAA